MSWGAIQTSAEVVGVHPAADWHLWIRQGRAPDSAEGNGFEHRMENDLQALWSMGCRQLAVTIEWAALEPTPDRHDPEQAEWHRRLLRAVSQAGLEPWACLVDGTLPGWFAIDRDGFRDPELSGRVWPRHVEWVAEQFGDLVGGWIPQREPTHGSMKSHVVGMAPPGSRDFTQATALITARLAADRLALQVLGGSAPVAAFHTARLIEPTRDPDDTEAAESVADSEAEWLERQLWSWTEHLDSPGSSFDRVFVQLRPAVEIGHDGRWTPSSRVSVVSGLERAAERAADHVDATRLTFVTDLAPVGNDRSAREDHLGAVWAMADEAGATWWASSPISGWHWENGFSIEPGLLGRDGSASVSWTDDRPREPSD